MADIRKRVRLDIATKQKILKEYMSGGSVSQKELANKYNCSRPAIASMIKNRKEIESRQNPKSKSSKKSCYPILDKALKIWFDQQKADGTIINSRELLGKARTLAIELELILEKPLSMSFVKNFMKRHDLSISSEGTSVRDTNEDTEKWREKLNADISNFDPVDVYKMEETRFLFRKMPTECYETKLGFGLKSSKFVTVLLILNMNGTEKMIKVIGKDPSPEIFSSHQFQPKNYFANSSSALNHKIFDEILFNLNEQMRNKNRKVLLYLEPVKTHFTNKDYSNLELKYLSQKNSCDTVKVFKQIYMTKFLTQLSTNIEYGGSYDPKDITFYKAFKYMEEAVQSISTDTIKTSFSKSGFVQTNVENSQKELAQLNDIWNILKTQLELHDQSIVYPSAEEFLEVDNYLTRADRATEESSEAILADSDDDTNFLPTSITDAYWAIHTLKNFYGVNQDFKGLNMICSHEDLISQHHIRRMK